MASRCRTCNAPIPRREPLFHSPEELAQFDALLPLLVDIAAEFMGCGLDDEGTPVEFVQWLVTERYVRLGRREPAGRPGRKRAA